MSEGFNGPEFNNVPEIPGGQAFYNAVTSFNKKAATAGFAWFKRMLGTMTEPFFRKGMGRRYYDYESFIPGIALWIGCGLLGRNFAPDASGLAAWFCEAKWLHPLAFIFQSKLLPLLTGLVLAGIQAVFGLQNIKEMARLHREGIPSHSRSRGTPRWPNEVEVFFKIEAVLLLLNWPLAVFFAIAYGMNAKLKAAQDAAITERYLDAMDADLENKYLEDSALGNCPSANTFLYHQIDPKIKPEVRQNIAAALVGKPVSGIAKAPQRNTAASQSQSSPNTPAPVSSPAEAPQPEHPASRPVVGVAAKKINPPAA